VGPSGTDRHTNRQMDRHTDGRHHSVIHLLDGRRRINDLNVINAIDVEKIQAIPHACSQSENEKNEVKLTKQ